MVFEESAIPGLSLTERETLEKILAQLLSKEDIHMKTRYDNPWGISQLEFLADYLDLRLTASKEQVTQKKVMIEGKEVIRKEKEEVITYLPVSAKLIRSIVEHFSTNLVSHKGQSRSEIVQCVSAGVEREKSVTDKLAKAP